MLGPVQHRFHAVQKAIKTADLYRGAGGRIMTAAHSGECAGHRTHDVIEIYLECAVWDVRIQHKPI